MDIGEVSQRSGVTTSTLRYYEEMKLIRSTGRKGLRRQYHVSVLENLSLILLGIQAGLSLDEIRLFFNNGKKLLIDREKLKMKAMEVEKKIKNLKAIKKGLLHASLCKASDHLECPKFKRLLSLATKKKLAQKPSANHAGRGLQEFGLTSKK